MTKIQKCFLYSSTVFALMLVPVFGYCSVESSLVAIQSRLIGTILPLAAILGLVFAGLSFVAGSPNAKSHLFLAIIGAIVGFMAPSIVSLIQSVAH